MGALANGRIKDFKMFAMISVKKRKKKNIAHNLTMNPDEAYAMLRKAHKDQIHKKPLMDALNKTFGNPSQHGAIYKTKFFDGTPTRREPAVSFTVTRCSDDFNLEEWIDEIQDELDIKNTGAHMKYVMTNQDEWTETKGWIVIRDPVDWSNNKGYVTVYDTQKL